MINNINKEQAIETLIELRDEVIEANSRQVMSLKAAWFKPDCLEYAINFMKAHKGDK